jgi:hypothetical protein
VSGVEDALSKGVLIFNWKRGGRVKTKHQTPIIAADDFAEIIATALISASLLLRTGQQQL